jgi:hypothetical protein
VAFFTLLAASLTMGALLLHLRQRAEAKLAAASDASAIQAISSAQAPTPVSLLVASDADGSLFPQARQLPLPGDAEARARVLLETLFELYADPQSPHPLSAQPAVSHVFVLALPGRPEEKLAVVDLEGGFVGQHPSGIAAETLTILSVCGTLHANLPQITQVRFLVDGAERATLAGHADLTRAYLAPAVSPGGGTEAR